MNKCVTSFSVGERLCYPTKEWSTNTCCPSKEFLLVPNQARKHYPTLNWPIGVSRPFFGQTIHPIPRNYSMIGKASTQVECGEPSSSFKSPNESYLRKKKAIINQYDPWMFNL